MAIGMPCRAIGSIQWGGVCSLLGRKSDPRSGELRQYVSFVVWGLMRVVLMPDVPPCRPIAIAMTQSGGCAAFLLVSYHMVTTTMLIAPKD